MSSISDEDCLSIEVRRDYIINDALREGRKKKFDPWKNLKVSTLMQCTLNGDVILLFRCSFSYGIVFLVQVNFVGEGAVDYGGPRREFFRLLPLRLADDNSLYFHGVEGQKFFLCNVNGYRVCFTKLKLKYGN